MLTAPVVIGVAAVAAFLVAMSIIATWFRKVGPNQALIVYGFRGTRVIKGHGTVVLPMLEHAHELSLEPASTLRRCRQALGAPLGQHLPNLRLILEKQ